MVDQPLGQTRRQHELAVGHCDEAVAKRVKPEPRATRLAGARVQVLHALEMARAADLGRKHPRPHRLGHAPTPIDAAPNLGAALGIDLHVKRDDCKGLAFGGNKVRQLEFHFGEARARGADTVLVTGAVQSNLVRIAAAAARRLGMEIHIQLEDRVEGADDLYRASGNLLLDPVYTAKAMAGLIAHARSGRIAAGSRVLFVNTGGQPALFACAESLGPWLSQAPEASAR